MKSISFKRLFGLILVLLLTSTIGCREESQYQYATITMTNLSDEDTNLWTLGETLDKSNIVKKGEQRTITIKRDLEALYWDITVYAGREDLEILSYTFRVSLLHSFVELKFNGTNFVLIE